MDFVSILISNRDSYEAIQLCVESIRRYTRHPHKIIVFDDRSRNKVDLAYLRNAQDSGWLELYENDSPTPLTHGGSLNRLINEICDTDHAVVMDCDVEITAKGWLGDLMAIAAADEKILAVVDTKEKGYTWKGFRTPIFMFWLGLLNMRAYRDGMQVDWVNDVQDASRQPYKALFEDLVHATKDAYFQSLVAQGKVDPTRWDEKIVSNDCGAKLWLKVTYDNPRGYTIAPQTPAVRDKFRHFGHAAIIGTMAHSDENSYDAVRARLKFDEIRAHLEELRCQS